MTFENIVGQNNIKSHLISNVGAGRNPHAQLFSGKSGYGPLPIAIAYAKYIIEFKSTTKASVDPLNHPAWTGQQRVLGSEGQVARFSKRFGGLGVTNK